MLMTGIAEDFRRMGTESCNLFKIPKKLRWIGGVLDKAIKQEKINGRIGVNRCSL